MTQKSSFQAKRLVPWLLKARYKVEFASSLLLVVFLVGFLYFCFEIRIHRL